MTPPALLGYPVTLLFLYFIFYSFVGWLWETFYCSVKERRPVARGFLYGPVCPIYGTGMLLMLLFFAPLKDNLVNFYFVAMFVMTVWEYLVGWFLETSTHIKYWDYSDRRFNIKGRVCLLVSLFWGVMSYIAVFLIHPPVARLMDAIAPWLQYTLCGSLAALLAVDAVTTIRHLALTTRAMDRLQTVGGELRLQMALAKADLSDDLYHAADQIKARLDTVRADLPQATAERLDRLVDSYGQLLTLAERQSRRFRTRYAGMRSYRYSLDDVRAYGAQWREDLRLRRRARRQSKKAS